jgi:hypothetical protein
MKVIDVRRGDRRNGAPAFNAGITLDDYIVRVMDHPLLTTDKDFGQQMQYLTPGDKVTFEVWNEQLEDARRVAVEIGAVGLTTVEVQDIRQRAGLGNVDLWQRPGTWVRLPNCFLHVSQYGEVLQMQRQMKEKQIELDRVKAEKKFYEEGEKQALEQFEQLKKVASVKQKPTDARGNPLERRVSGGVWEGETGVIDPLKVQDYQAHRSASKTEREADLQRPASLRKMSTGGSMGSFKSDGKPGHQGWLQKEGGKTALTKAFESVGPDAAVAGATPVPVQMWQAVYPGFVCPFVFAACVRFFPCLLYVSLCQLGRLISISTSLRMLRWCVLADSFLSYYKQKTDKKAAGGFALLFYLRQLLCCELAITSLIGCRSDLTERRMLQRVSIRHGSSSLRSARRQRKAHFLLFGPQ